MYEKKLQEWYEAGILPNEAFHNILAYERKQPKKQKLPLLLTIGLIFFALAIFSFIAANWSIIPAIVKVTFMLILMWGFYVLGHFSETKHISKPIIFRVLGLIMFGASVLVTAQTFHLSSSNTTLPWLLFIAAIAHYFIWKHNAFTIFGLISGTILLTSLVSTIGWIEWLLFVAVTFNWFKRSKHAASKMASWLLLFGSGLLLWAFVGITTPLLPIWTLFVLVLLLFRERAFKNVLYPLYLIIAGVMLIGYLATRGATDLPYVDLSIIESIALAMIGVVMAVILWIKFRPITWIALLSCIGLLSLDTTAIGLAIIAEISALSYLLVAQRQERPLKFGFFYFIAVQFVIYVIYAWERLGMTLFFLLGAMLLFVLSGIAWAFNRRKEGAKR